MLHVVTSEGFILSHYIISTIRFIFALLSFVQIMISSVLCLVMHGYEFETLDNIMSCEWQSCTRYYNTQWKG